MTCPDRGEASDAAVEHVAAVVGDTLIDFHTMSPVNQWKRIFRLLYAQGFDVQIEFEPGEPDEA